MARMSGKKALMEMLRAEEVEYIFGNPGTSESPIMSALEGYPDIKYMLATQEGVAMGMADGYAAASGKPAFVNLHIETGLANGISLLHHAFAEGRETPMIVTSGNKDVRKLAEGRTALTEMVRMFTKWSVEVTHPEQVPGVMRRAFTEATTPPTGPVYVGFAANAFDDEAEVEIRPSSKVFARHPADTAGVDAAVRMLVDVQRPVLIVGDRLSRSGGVGEAVRLAELVGARVHAASYSEMNFPTSHPHYLGRINMGLPLAKETLAASDLVLAVGMNVFEGFFYSSGPVLGPNTRLVHVDSTPGEVGKSEPTDVGVVADPKAALSQICDLLEDGMSGAARESARGRSASIAAEKQQLRAGWESDLKAGWNGRPMSPARMMTELARSLPSDAIIADDSIASRDAVHGSMEFNEPGSIYASSNFGAIGWGMGGALGVKLAHPGRPVVAIVGDGSAMMTVQGLWTAANYNIPVVYLICNNGSYRILKLNMNRYQTLILGEDRPSSSYIGMDFLQPFDMAAIANAMGVYGRTVAEPGQIGPALEEALSLGKPAVLDVVIDGSVV